MGLSLFVVMFGMLTFYRWRHQPRQLRHHHRQGVPAAADGHGPARLGAVRRLPALRRARGGAAARGADLDLAAALRDGDPEPGASSPSPTTRPRWRSGRSASALGNSLMLGFGVATVGVVADGAAGLDHLPLAASGARRDRVPGDVPAGRAAPGVRPGAAVGLAQHPDPDLRHAVAAGAGLFHGDAAARRAHAGGRGAADRQEPRGMRPRLRRRLGLPDAHRDPAAAASRASSRRGC